MHTSTHCRFCAPLPLSKTAFPLVFALAAGFYGGPREGLAAITLIRDYRLGEADPGALPGLPGNPVTIDSASGINATKVGNETYGVGLFPGSTLSMQFQDTDSRYVAPAALPGVTDNFGIEAYIDPSSVAVFDGRPFYNGGNGLPTVTPLDGFGLEISGGMYQALLGGVTTIPTGVFAVPGVPVEMALVENGGTAEVFVDGVLKNAIAAVPLPAAAVDAIAIGNFLGAGVPFAGIVDEARIFTFPAGGFSPGDLLPVPEPSTLALGLVGLAMTVAARQRRRFTDGRPARYTRASQRK